MAYKCKSCGYRFKPSDSDLCPECFTARDDISCFDIGDGKGRHNHFKDSADGGDFIAQQLREEARMSGDELREQISGYTDGIRRSFNRQETPPNTYGNFTQPQRITFTAQPSSNPFPQMTGTQTQPKKMSGGCGLAVFIAIIVMANMGSIIKKAGKLFDDSDTDVKPQIVTAAPAVTEKPSVTTAPAASDEVSGEMSSYTYYDKYLGYIEPASLFNAREIYAAPDLTESVWYALKCDITFSDENCKAEEIALYGYENNVNEVFSWKTVNEFGTGSKLYGVPLCFPICQRYEVLVTYTDGNGEKGSLLFEPQLGDILSELGVDTKTPPDPADFKYSYDYGTYDLESSMNDMNGTSYRLKLNGTPHQFSTADAPGQLVFEDMNLSTSDLKLCRIMVVNGNNAPGYSDYMRATLVGLDANCSPVYVYSVDGSDEIPISSAVKYYELILGIADADGFEKELHFAFYSNDLYDSK